MLELGLEKSPMTIPPPGSRNVMLVAQRTQIWQELAGFMLSAGIHFEWVPASMTPAEIATDLARPHTVLLIDLEPDKARSVAIVSACRQSTPGAPVIVVAPNPSIECARRLRQAGVFYLALSPISADELEAVLTSAFECFDGKRPDTSTCRATYHILLVDDDPDFATSMSALLESRGYIVSVARSGKEGLAKISAEAPDLIVLDVMMEYDSSGYEVTETLKVAPAFECHRNIPVLMVSAIPTDPSTRFSMAGEVDMVTPSRYLTKPVDIPRFLESIEELLGEQPQHAAV
jgi:CheY-like chemotaxis protein